MSNSTHENWRCSSEFDSMINRKAMENLHVPLGFLWYLLVSTFSLPALLLSRRYSSLRVLETNPSSYSLFVDFPFFILYLMTRESKSSLCYSILKTLHISIQRRTASFGTMSKVDYPSQAALLKVNIYSVDDHVSLVYLAFDGRSI